MTNFDNNSEHLIKKSK